MRPIGVLLISLLLLFNGIFCFFGGIGMILFKEELFPIIQRELETIAEGELSSSIFEELYDRVSIVVLFIGIIFLLNAFGLLMLKNWARILAIVLFAFQLIYSILLLYYDPLAIINIAIALGVIWYLLRKSVKERFTGKRMSIEERILGQKL